MFLLFWIVCGYFASTMFFNYSQNEFEGIAEQTLSWDVFVATVSFLLGPFSLISNSFLIILRRDSPFKYGILKYKKGF